MMQIKNRLPDLKEVDRPTSDTTNDDIVEEDEEPPKKQYKLYNGPVGNLLKRYLQINDYLKGIENRLMDMKHLTTAAQIDNLNDFNKIRGESIKLGNNVIKRFKKLESNLPDEKDYTTLARMKRLLYYGFFQQYIILWSKNEQFLTEFDQKLKKRLQSQSQILNCHLTDEDIEKLIENKRTNLFTSNILQDTETQRKTLQEIQDRFDDLKKLEKSITEVHNLFINLQTLVAEQGDSIQCIETHFNAARNYVEEATKTLKVVEQMKKSRSCLMRCCCF